MSTGNGLVFAWDKTVAVNIPEIDRQHQYLFALLNHLHEAMIFGQGRIMVAGVLNELTGYAESHFASEEAYMRGIAYSGITEHQEEHAMCVRRLAMLRGQYEQGATEIAVEVMSFLAAWLREHIGRADKEFASTTPLPPLPPDCR